MPRLAVSWPSFWSNFRREEQDFDVRDRRIWLFQQATAPKLAETTELKAKMSLFDLLLCQWETPDLKSWGDGSREGHLSFAHLNVGDGGSLHLILYALGDQLVEQLS